MIDTPTLITGLGVAAGVIVPIIKMVIGWINDLRASNKTQADNIDALSASLLEEKHARLEKEGEIVRFQIQLNQIEDDKNRIEAARIATETEAIQAKRTMQEQIDSLYNRLSDMEKTFKERFEEQAQTIESQSAKIQRLTSQVEDLNKDLAKERHNAKVNEARYESEKEALAAQVKAQSEILAERNRLIEAQKVKIETVTNENISLKSKIESLETQIADLTVQVDKLAQSIDDMKVKPDSLQE